jgi:hypothetical protein
VRYALGQLASAWAWAACGIDCLTISWQTWAAALRTPASLPEAAWSHRLVSFAFASAEMFGAAAIRDLHAAMAALTAGLLAIAEPPVEPAEDAALLDDAAAVVLELVAGAADDDVDAVLEEELLLPHPPITAATASRAESFLIMADTLAATAAAFSVD